MAAKNDRWTLFSSRHVPAHRTDIAVALRGCNAGFEHRMACGPTYDRAVLGSVLRGWVLPSRNTAPWKEHSVFFGNSELQVLEHKPQELTAFQQQNCTTIARWTGLC